jgi:hypothetical protein
LPNIQNVPGEPIASAPASTPDTKLIDLPGLRADFAVRALTMEGVVCGLECQGIRKIRLPDGPPEEPFAVTLPVSIYVPSDKLAEAQIILRSLESDDLIGAQWESVPEGEESEGSDLGPSLGPPDWPPTEDPEPEPSPTVGPPQGESTTLRLIVFLIIASLAAFTLSR